MMTRAYRKSQVRQRRPKSAVQKPKHCLTCSFLHRLLKRYSVYRVDMAPEMQKQAKRAALASAGNCSVSSVTSIPSTLYNTIRCISLIYRFAHVVAEHCYTGDRVVRVAPFQDQNMY